MIPEPTAEDLARDAEKDYARFAGAFSGGELTVECAWIRLREHERKRADAAERERDEARREELALRRLLAEPSLNAKTLAENRRLQKELDEASNLLGISLPILREGAWKAERPLINAITEWLEKNK